MERERWASQWGAILAVAGSAVGLGNFLRFPGYAAANGGGAFMIPYLLALLLVGLPLVWMEWTLGRFGGALGHGTGPGILEAVAKRPGARYIGVIGVFGPFAILVYYTVIEAWTLGYTVFSLTGHVTAAGTGTEAAAFLGAFSGEAPRPDLVNPNWVHAFVAATVLLNLLVIYRGIRGGIEKMCKLAMPLLFLLAIGLLVRTATLGHPFSEDRGFLEGLAFLWTPDMAKLTQPVVWLKASGQIFFTLSIGIGVILTYASYLRKKDDIAFSGLAAAGTNEFAEVILAGMTVIPIAFMYYGAEETARIAANVSGGSTLGFGFVSLPIVFHGLPLGSVISAAWFLLLFIAAITSSVSLAQPCVAFLEDEFGLSRRRATLALGGALVALLVPFSLLWAKGWLEEFDLWTGNVMLILFGLVESIFFGWVLGIDRAWAELHEGARMRVPRIFRFVCKWITPAILIAILAAFAATEWKGVIMLEGKSAEELTIRWIARGLLFATFAAFVGLAWFGARRRARQAGE